MGWSLENWRNTVPVEGNQKSESVEQQLRLRFGEAREKEAQGWQAVLHRAKNLKPSDWAKLVTAGVLFGAGWYLDRRNILSNVMKRGAKKLVETTLKGALTRFKPK